MSTLAASNPFENPLVLVLIFLLSALSNWWMSRRRQKQAEQAAQAEQSGETMASSPSARDVPAPPELPPNPTSLEETLRRLLGPEFLPQLPPPRRGELFEETPATPAPPPPRRPPQPTTVPPTPPRHAPGTWVTSMPPAPLATAAHPLPHSSPARAMHGTHRHRSHPHSTSHRAWRNPRLARQAIVASILLGPPKGLES